MQKYFLLLATVSSFSMVFIPQTAHSETLQEAVQKALTTHPALERANLNTEIAKEGITEQRSEFFPKLSASVSGGRLYGDNATSRGLSVTRGAGYSWLWEGNAAVNQMVFDWNQTSNRVDSAAAQRMSALHDLEDTKQSFAYQAVQNYIALYRSDILYQAAQANLKDMTSYRKRLLKLVEGGGADEAAASRARDMVLAAENALIGAKGQKLAAMAGYIEVMGEEPKTDLVKPPMPFTINDDEDLDSLIDKIQSHHPQIRSVREQIEALDYKATAEQKEILPKVNSELSYTKRDQKDIIGGESLDARAMLRLNWNLETGGAQLARTQKARLQENEAHTRLEELRRALGKNIRIAMAGLEIAREQRDIQQKRYDELKQTLKTYKQQFEASKRTLLDVAQTQAQVFAAQNDYLTAEYALLEAAYGFLTSQGSITDAIDILTMMQTQTNTQASVSSVQNQPMKTAKQNPIIEASDVVYEAKMNTPQTPLQTPPQMTRNQEKREVVAQSKPIAKPKMVETGANPKADEIAFETEFAAMKARADVLEISFYGDENARLIPAQKPALPPIAETPSLAISSVPSDTSYAPMVPSDLDFVPFSRYTNVDKAGQ